VTYRIRQQFVMAIVTPHLMEEDTGELRNPFPSPPSHYTKYASHNLRLLALLKERAGDITEPEPNQQEILHDQPDVPDWPLTQLEKPRVDWILDEPDAYYDVFGDRWFVRLFSSGIRHALNCRLGQGNDTISRRAGWKSALPTRSYHRFIY